MVSKKKFKSLMIDSLELISGKTTQDYLSYFKEFYIEQNQHLISTNQSGFENVHKRSLLIDMLIKQIKTVAEHEFSEKHPTEQFDDIAIVALGGYGREELCVNSDIDVMFLFRRNVTVFINFIIKKMLTMLWDIGLEIGHSSRSIFEAINEGRFDEVSRTSMLESRLICGSSTLFQIFERVFNKKVLPYKSKKYVQKKISDNINRWKNYENTVFLSEPNIKESPGGLRDFHSTLWIVHTYYGSSDKSVLISNQLLTEEEWKQIQTSVDFLFKIRNELHLIHTFHTDNTLTHSTQREIATRLQYEKNSIQKSSELFMREYYEKASLIHRLCEKVIKTVSHHPIFIFKKKIHSLEGWIKIKNEIYVQDISSINNKPSTLFECLLYMIENQCRLSSQTKNLIHQNIDQWITPDFLNNPHHRDLFLRILKSPKSIQIALRALQKSGMLAKYLPAFGRAFCFVQHDMYHRYTLDEHTIRTL